MTALRFGLLFAALVAVGCGKKEDAPAAKGGAAPAASKSGLAWTPLNYDEMSPSCKKALACCEAVASAAGAKTADDFNLKCSGPALWKAEECDTDLKSRVAMFEADAKPVPDACK